MARKKRTTKIAKPIPQGVELRTTAEIASYHADKGAIHASAIKAGRKSMLSMRAYITGQSAFEPTAAMRLGSLVDMALLTPERFAAEVVVWEGGQKRGKEWDAFCAIHTGKEIVKREEITLALSICTAVWSVPAAAELVASTRHQVRVDWDDPAYGRATMLADMLGDDVLADLKVTQTVDPRRFARHAYDIGWLHQLAWYRRGAPRKAVKILAVESKPPHDVAIYAIAGMHLDVFYRQASTIAAEYRKCEAAGEFPGAAQGERELDIEPWMLDGPGGESPDGMDEIAAAGL